MERTVTEAPQFPNMPDPEPQAPPVAPLRQDLRVLHPERDQMEWVVRHLDATLPGNHPARVIWRFLERLDLSDFYTKIRAVGDGPGRSATDPQLLLALWLLASVEDVGSARKLATLCEEHDAYRWMRGGVPVNYHMLSDFRVAHREELDDLLTQILAAMMVEDLVELRRVAQDGMRVRAAAGASSFRRKKSLERCQQEAREQIDRLARQREAPDPGVTRREQVARERAAREREERVTKALGHLPALQAIKDRQKRTKGKEAKKVTEARVSTTDPEARVLKMPDGGFRPAYNVQLATDAASGVIVGASVINTADEGQAVPMEAQVAQRGGRHPEDYLVDGGFATRKDITTLEKRDVRVYAPVRPVRGRPEEERYRPRYRDSPQVITWRARMATAEAQTVYRERAATAEWSNAQLCQHGMQQFTVRGVHKVTAATLLLVIAHDLMRWAALTA